MAALGDEFSYIQDRYSREGYLRNPEPTALARCFRRASSTYRLDEGLKARTWLQLTMTRAVIPRRIAGLGRSARGANPSSPSRSASACEAISTSRPTAWPAQPTGCTQTGTDPAGATSPTCDHPASRDRRARAVGHWRATVAAPCLARPDPRRDRRLLGRAARCLSRRGLSRATRPCGGTRRNRRAGRGGAADPLRTRLRGQSDNGDAASTGARRTPYPFELDLTVAFVGANIVPATAGLTAPDHFAIASPPATHPDIPTHRRTRWAAQLADDRSPRRSFIAAVCRCPKPSAWDGFSSRTRRRSAPSPVPESAGRGSTARCRAAR